MTSKENTITINPNDVLRGHDGKPLVAAFEPGVEPTPITVSRAVNHALLALLNIEETGEEKFRLWQLAARIEAGETIALSVEDIGRIKRRAAILFGPAIYGPIAMLIDPNG